jgi:type IV secretion system pilin
MNTSALIQKIKIWPILIVSVLALGLTVALAPSAHSQQIENSLCGGSNFNINPNPNCEEVTGSGEGRLNATIENIVNVLSVIVGIVAVVMIIIGGFRYITSGGDSGNVAGAKNTILYAIVGLIIVALAQVIVRFVLSKST